MQIEFKSGEDKRAVSEACVSISSWYYSDIEAECWIASGVGSQMAANSKSVWCLDRVGIEVTYRNIDTIFEWKIYGWRDAWEGADIEKSPEWNEAKRGWASGKCWKRGSTQGWRGKAVEGAGREANTESGWKRRVGSNEQDRFCKISGRRKAQENASL